MSGALRSGAALLGAMGLAWACAIFAATPVAAQLAPNDGMVEATFCNYGGQDMVIAVAGRLTPNGKGVTRGWASIPDTQCRSVGRYGAGDFHYYAKWPYGWVVGGPKTTPFCTQEQQFEGGWIGAACAAGEQLLQFVDVQIAAPSWSLNLYGPAQEAVLPTVAAAPASATQAMYDSCSSHWNSVGWTKKPGSKAMAAASRRNADGTFATRCAWYWSQPDMAAAIKTAHEGCETGGWACFDFARGDSLTPWARTEYLAIKAGDRK